MKRKLLIILASVFVMIGAFISYRIYVNKIRQKADVALFLTGDNQTAIKHYSTLIKKNPKAPGLYYNRGDAYRNEGDLENALKDYRQALKYGIGDSLQTFLRIGLAEKALLNFEESQVTFLTLLALCEEKDNVELWAANYHIGQIQFKKREYRQAISYYNRAMKYSKSKFNLYHRANAYYALGLIDSANSDFNNSIEFVKRDLIAEFPNSSLAKCDTCGFPFGTEEYELLTEPSHRTIIEALDKVKGNKEIEEKVKSDLDKPIDIKKVESALIEVGPIYHLTDSNDTKRSIPFEYLEQITNEMNISNNIGLTKFLPKYRIIFILKDGQSRTFRMTDNTFKEKNDLTYRFRTENYADSIWEIAFKP